MEADSEREIIVTVGAMEAAFLTLYSLVEPGDEVVIHAPYWINYSQVVRSLGAVPVFVYTRPEDGFQLQADDLEAVLTKRTKVVVLNSPNNPTGAVIPEKTLRKSRSLHNAAISPYFPMKYMSLWFMTDAGAGASAAFPE